MMAPGGDACEKSRPDRRQLQWAAQQEQLYSFMPDIGASTGCDARGTLYGSTLPGGEPVHREKGGGDL